MDDHGRLADAVQSRRAALMLSQAELASAAGLSESTVRSIESGRRTNLRASNRRALAEALGWTSDSIERIAEGGEPVEQPQVPSPEIVAELQALRDQVGRLTELVEQMVSQRAGRR